MAILKTAGRPGGPDQPLHDPNLGPRLDRFRSALTVAGGPVEALDLDRTGLDILWRWFVETHPPNPGRLYDEAALRECGPLPAWYPRSEYLARTLDPRLLQVTDGLAAHVTNILVAAEPGADWVVEKDAYVAGKVPKLRLPGRRPGPIDEQIAGFVSRMHLEHPFYQVNDPMAFVDAFAEFGDPRSRDYADQTAKEARDLVESISAGHDARLMAFLDAVAARGGPRDRLDFSRDSLMPLWTWLTSLPLPAQPVPDREMRRQDPPWWYLFSGRMIGQILGPDLCWLATGAGDYVAEVVFRRVPGSGWTMGADRAGDFREPMLRVGVDVYEQDIYDSIPRLMTIEAVQRLLPSKGLQRSIGPNDLRDTFDWWVDLASRPAAPEPEPEPAYTIGFAAPASATESGSGANTAVSFSDDAAHNESGRIDRFVRRLADDAGVLRAFREDRDLVYVAAPRLSSEELTDLIARSWTSVGRAR